MRIYPKRQNALAVVVDIVSSHVSTNRIAVEDVAALISNVYQAIAIIVDADNPSKVPYPAVAVCHSIKTNYLVCLEDAKRCTLLKRHLRNHHNMSPDEYRLKWQLGRDYPMVPPAYRERRSSVAKAIRFGIRGKGTS